MLELCELDLKLALEARGPLRKDIENQSVPIEHADLCEPFEIALLIRRERVTDENQLGADRFRPLGDFLGLARPDEELRIRPVDPDDQLGLTLGARRQGKRTKLLQGVGRRGMPGSQM